jgi:hypothetical protein
MVTFDGENLRIKVVGETLIDVRDDLYIPWKQWLGQDENMKYPEAIRPVGGDEIGGGSKSPLFFFLKNNWKIEVDGTTCQFQFNLYCDEDSNDNTDPFIYINGGGATNIGATSPILSVGSGLSSEEHTKLMGMVDEIFGRRIEC